MKSREPRSPADRRASLPDLVRIERCKRLPEFGPRIFFFSGGTALREATRALKRYTHNSIHLVTPFDSGGSSAVLRRAFQMLGVGDLRNRLMALADETELGNPHVSALFSHRLDEDGEASELVSALSAMIEGSHELIAAVVDSRRRIIRAHLARFRREMPVGFDLRGANIGNLILAGGFLNNEHDLDSVLYQFSKFVSARGTVRPTAKQDAHLAAIHEGGERTLGQHLLGKPETLDRGRIEDLYLTASLEGGEPVEVPADEVSLELIGDAELICLPMGSFFGSLLANLLPRGVGEALAARDCPKVYIPNAGEDPEMRGYTLCGAVEKLIELVRRDAGRDVPVSCILDFVLIDGRGADYALELDLDGVRDLGIEVIDMDLAAECRDRLDAQKLVEALISLV